MRDPYEVLGIGPDADAAEIRAAFRRLAKRLHPDLNPGDKAAAQAFREVSEAIAVLGGRERHGRGAAGEGEPFPFRPDEEPAASPFEDLYGEEGVSAFQAGRPARGEDVSYSLAVPLPLVATGGTQRVRLAGDAEVAVEVPPGVAEGEVLRVPGGGLAGRNGGPPGDALVTVSITPHRLFRREGRNLLLVLPVTLAEAVKGARVEVPTLEGRVAAAIPPGSDGGTRLRLRGRGLPERESGRRGDLLLELSLRLPPEPDATLGELLAEWEARQPYDPRAGLFAGEDALP